MKLWFQFLVVSLVITGDHSAWAQMLTPKLESKSFYSLETNSAENSAMPVSPSLSEPKNGFSVVFQRPNDVPSSATALLSITCRTTPVAPEKAVAWDVYWQPDGDGSPQLTRENFVGTSVPFYGGGSATVDIDISPLFERPMQGSSIRLFLTPRGQPGESPELKLSMPPRLSIAPAAFPLELVLEPLDRGRKTTDEPAIFFQESSGSTPTARLYHQPRRIERVYSYRTGREYKEGVDWKLEKDGTLSALPGSALPVGTDAELHPTEDQPGVITFPTNDGRKILYSEIEWPSQHQVWITYEHEENRIDLPSAGVGIAQLPRTIGKLKSKTPVNIVLIGDSITQGSCASSRSALPPYMPSWPEAVARFWRVAFGGPIKLTNRALGGTTIKWGAENASILLGGEKPDLCIIAFGMNDRGGGVSPEDFRRDLEVIMLAARTENPDVEFILVSGMLANPEWGPGQPILDYQKVLHSLGAKGVAIADVTAVHTKLLKKKSFIDLAGNNLNHPNDYLVRWYAQVVGGLLSTGKN